MMDQDKKVEASLLHSLYHIYLRPPMHEGPKKKFAFLWKKCVAYTSWMDLMENTPLVSQFHNNCVVRF